jgi:hypothetical protein
MISCLDVTYRLELQSEHKVSEIGIASIQRGRDCKEPVRLHESLESASLCHWTSS